MVQCPRLCSPGAGGLGSISGQRTGPHMLQLSILQLSILQLRPRAAREREREEGKERERERKKRGAVFRSLGQLPFSLGEDVRQSTYMVQEMESAPGEMGALSPLGPGSDAARLPVLLGAGFLPSCFPPEYAFFLDLTASCLVRDAVPVPADGPAWSLPGVTVRAGASPAWRK